jgi:hypothetical protein
MVSFRASRGRCILDEENLYISSSWSGLFRRYLEGGIVGKLMIASFLPLPVIVLANMGTGTFQPVLSGLKIGAGMGIILITSGILINYFRGFSYDRKIPRSSINKFKVVEGTKGLSQPRFIVKFEKNGEERNRYIVMPSEFLSYGEEEFEEAKKLLENKGFEVTE